VQRGALRKITLGADFQDKIVVFSGRCGRVQKYQQMSMDHQFIRLRFGAEVSAVSTPPVCRIILMVFVAVRVANLIYIAGNFCLHFELGEILHRVVDDRARAAATDEGAAFFTWQKRVSFLFSDIRSLFRAAFQRRFGRLSRPGAQVHAERHRNGCTLEAR
jgi:hypothetical protein